MTLRRTALPLILLVLCLLAVAPSSLGQTESATLSGLITDPQGKVVPDVAVEITNVDTNISEHQTTNSVGLYVVVGLKPGRYRVTVTKEGFRRIDLVDLVLNVQDVLSRNFELQLGSVLSSITVTADAANANMTDATVSTVVDRQFVENIPLNGRSFQSLILLAPGVTAVPGASIGSVGEFSVNGQRTETNYYTVDGVSANMGFASLNGAGITPAETALGTTHSLVSIDALQEFRINTSTYSAEFGRTPGAQISFGTRSGNNVWHGSLFDYFRNDALDANNWFNDASALPKTAERQNDFGGTLGGPVEIPGLYDGRNKTFFFFSYEGLRLIIPQPAFTNEVPDTYLRHNAPTAIQPLLNAFPVQNGADDPNCLGPGAPAAGATCLAAFTGTSSSPSSLDAYSIRLDHTFGNKLSIFGRYSDTPSYTQSRPYIQYGAYGLSNQTIDVETLTMGATSLLSPRLSNELRFNYTKNKSTTVFSSDNYDGAIPVTTAQLFPGITPPQYTNFEANLNFGTFPLLSVQPSASPAHQWNITDSVSTVVGNHTLKYGIDYRRIVGTQGVDALINVFNYNSPQDVLSNSASQAVVQTFGPVATGLFTNFSAFAQDEWKLSSRFHVSLGLRWDVNPPPRSTSGPQPYTLDQVTNLATATVAPAGTPLWHTDYRGFAPRIGMAYQLRQSPGHETVLRGGFGVFYDQGVTLGLQGLFSGVGIGSTVDYSNVPFPFTPAQQTLPAPSLVPPYNDRVNAFDPNLRLPYTLQWNVAIQQGLGKGQTLTVSYVAAGGRKLLSSLDYVLTGINPNFGSGSDLLLTTNSSNSNYNSLQAQFQRRLSHSLQALASYTWSHAIDNLSFGQAFQPVLLRGNADFDVRQNFSAAVTYDVPGSYSNPFMGAVLKHWEIDLRQTARTALPVDIDYGFGSLPDGQQLPIRPDMVPGVPIYLNDPAAPGGRVVNFNAFTAPAGLNGNEPRNFVRGFAAWQTDFAIRREFPLLERLKLQFRAESFNLFNHPNFGSIYNSLADGPSLFGLANSTLNNSLGGLNSLYQMGGPRSLQLSLKFLF